MKNSDRYYWRGTTPLGILNTVLAFLFNIVLVRQRDISTGKTVKFSFDRADNHPPKKKKKENINASKL